MTDPACLLSFDDLVGYLVGDDPAAGVDAFEEHLFTCDRCRRRIDSLESLRRGISDAVRDGSVGGNVSRSFVARASKDGLSIREYRIPEGETVACTAGPEDLVLVRLSGAFEGLEELRLDAVFEDLDRQETADLPRREVVVDRDLQEVVLVFPGQEVRAYPRSRWTLRILAQSPGGPKELGPFVMDHTPASDL